MNNPTGRQKGVTLVELMITLGIMAILASLAAPAFITSMDKRRTVDAAEDLYSHLQKARLTSISTNSLIYVRFTTPTNEWHYGMSATTGCDPSVDSVSTSGACTINMNTESSSDAILHQTSSSAYKNITLTFSTNMPTSKEIEFDPVRGTANVNNVYAEVTSSSSGHKLRVYVGKLGQLRVCRPSTAKSIGGYSDC